MTMKSLIKLLLGAFILVLIAGLALAALQGTNLRPSDAAKNSPAAAPTSHSNPTLDETVPTDNANDQKAQSEARIDHGGKMSLDLGSMPCPPDDQGCRAKEKERLAAAPQEHL
jgi:hypothetical protein